MNQVADLTNRCDWVGGDPLMIAYHDQEWGVPVHEDKVLFEFLILEGAQAGLSWMTILRKRENYRQAFDGFNPEVVARYDEQKITQLLANPGIVRNRLKINAAILNASLVLKLRRDFGSFDAYIWGLVGGSPQQNAWRSLAEIPAKTAAAEVMSKDLTKRGFKFVGPTICYAFMQAVGMVNDHLVSCFRYSQV
ncbi:MAG: DNA-3-methyladenine glycosylase I [Anaerolineales bacterium]|nr:MAG: DNA-3-methyladenine glycosylase I [Anaerolineales bacterium]